MTNDKNLQFHDEGGDVEGEGEAEHAPRARNRTVMLTPDITGQVRARLAKELDPAALADAGAHAGERGGGFAPVAPRRPAADQSSRSSGGFVDPRRVDPVTRTQRASDPAPAAPAARTAPAAPDGDVMEWKKSAALVGILVTHDRDDNGEIYPLRSGRLIVTSEMPSGGNFLFLANDTVSSMHAIVRVGEDGAVQILDQLSEHGTTVRRVGGEEVKLSGDKADVHHGDEVSFGDRKFMVCILPKRA